MARETPPTRQRAPTCVAPRFPILSMQSSPPSTYPPLQCCKLGICPNIASACTGNSRAHAILEGMLQAGATEHLSSVRSTAAPVRTSPGKPVQWLAHGTASSRFCCISALAIFARAVGAVLDAVRSASSIQYRQGGAVRIRLPEERLFGVGVLAALSRQVCRPDRRPPCALLPLFCEQIVLWLFAPGLQLLAACWGSIHCWRPIAPLYCFKTPGSWRLWLHGVSPRGIAGGPRMASARIQPLGGPLAPAAASNVSWVTSDFRDAEGKPMRC